MAENSSSYLDRLKLIRTQIDEKCHNLIQNINEHKSKLHTVINDIESDFLQLENVRENEITKLSSMMTMYEDKSGNDNRLNDVQSRVSTTLQAEINDLQSANYEKNVEFVWNDQLGEQLCLIANIEVNKELVIEKEMGKETNDLVFEKEETNEEKVPGKDEDKTEEKGEVEKKESSRSYSSLNIPSVESYSIGSHNDQLGWPTGVAISEDNSFFVADYTNNRVSVFTQWGKLKSNFSQPGMMGLVNNMQGPWGVCCHGNSIYVTESKSEKQYAAVKMFDLEGKYCSGVVKFGSEKGELNDPTGLSFDVLNNELYVCDRLNNRVQVFTDTLIYKGIFTNKMIFQPRDIKVASETVFILDENDPCMHLFDKSTCRIKTHLISQGPKRDVVNAWFFTIDSEGNFLVSDRDSNSIAVFSQEGEQLCKIGCKETINFVKPTGIAVNAVGKIIVVSEKPSGCVQIL